METAHVESLFDTLAISYEHAYGANPPLIAILSTLISHLPPASHILDVGCGTGTPVASTLAAAGMHVTGIDLSQAMISLAQQQIPGGTFVKADMRTYEPRREYDAVVVAFSLLLLSYKDCVAALRRYVRCLRVGGLVLLVTVPADRYVKDKALYDETGSYVEGFESPFMGHAVRTTLFTVQGSLELLKEVGLEVVSSREAKFQPKGEGFEVEDQLFVIARRRGSE